MGLGNLRTAMTRADEPNESTVISIANPSLDNLVEQLDHAKTRLTELKNEKTDAIASAEKRVTECHEAFSRAVMLRVPELAGKG